MKQCGVYVIRCTVGGREYVGSSVNMVKRIREHFYRLEKGIHRNPDLQQVFNKYGKDSFTSHVVLYCDPINLEQYERMIMDKLQPAYNIVHTMHTKEGRKKSLKRAMREDREYMNKQIRFMKILERWQKRTHRS